MNTVKGPAQLFLAALIGTAGTCVHYTVMACSLYVLAFPVCLATSAGFCCGAATNYFLSRAFVFSSSRKHLAAMPRFFITALVGLCVNSGCLYLFCPDSQHSPWLTQGLVTTGAFFLTFAINKLWTFGRLAAR